MLKIEGMQYEKVVKEDAEVNEVNEEDEIQITDKMIDFDMKELWKSKQEQNKTKYS
jgi:hypothetical protein